MAIVGFKIDKIIDSLKRCYGKNQLFWGQVSNGERINKSVWQPVHFPQKATEKAFFQANSDEEDTFSGRSKGPSLPKRPNSGRREQLGIERDRCLIRNQLILHHFTLKSNYQSALLLDELKEVKSSRRRKQSLNRGIPSSTLYIAFHVFSSTPTRWQTIIQVIGTTYFIWKPLINILPSGLNQALRTDGQTGSGERYDISNVLKVLINHRPLSLR